MGEVGAGVASLSNLVKNMIADSGTSEVIPLPNVSSDTLKKIIAYMEYHKDAAPAEIPKPLKSAQLQENGVCDFDAEFVDCGEQALFDLVLAANYLDIKPLLDLTCAKVS